MNKPLLAGWWSACLMLLCQPVILSAQNDLVINEVMAANLGEALDPSYNYGAWIEIYNPTTSTISLKGYIVKDAKGNSYTLTSSHGSVSAKSFKNLWFDHLSDTYKTQIPFKLDCDGGTITLMKGQTEISSVTYPLAVSRTSWARTTDGATTFALCGWPTPETTNTSTSFSAEVCPMPVINGNGGAFSGSTSFEVTTPLNVTLRYTTDGTVPTTTNGQTANATTTDDSLHYKFNVSSTKCYRFRCISDNLLPSSVKTISFLYAAPSKINLLSLVCNPEDLYDDMKGIYVKGKNGGWSYWETANYYQDWDRPVNFEIYDADASLLLNQEADMTMSGASSRSYNSLKSFKLKADKKFDGHNQYSLLSLFPDKTHHRFKDILVRNGGSHDGERQIDVALQRVIRHSGIYIDTQDDRPVKVYFNGKEMGVMFVRERTNRQYGEVNYGMDTDSMDTFEDNDIFGMEISHGSWTSFNNLYNAAKQASTSTKAWQTVNELLDVEDYINYFALETYLANEDWPQNNIKIFRDYEDGHFHYIIQDLDACTKDNYYNNGIFGRLEDNTEYWYAEAGIGEAKQVVVFLNLMNNATFKKQFIDAFCLVAGSVFDPDFVKAELNALQAELLPYYTSGSTTMKENIQSLITKLNASWQSKRLSYLESWSRAGIKTKNRITAKISTDCSAARLHLNNLPIPRNTFSGTLYLPITLKAECHSGYSFKGWEKDGKIVSKEISLTISASGTYKAIYEASLEEQKAAVVINEVAANGGIYMNEFFKRRDWIELYNRTDATIDIAGMYLSDDIADPHKYQIAATASVNTKIAPKSHLIVWADDKEGTSELHAPFKLANDSNQLVLLTAEDDTWADTLQYHPQGARHSVGRYPDGSNSIYRFDIPTFGSTNLYTARALPLQFSPVPYIPTGVIEVDNNLDINNATYNLAGQLVSDTYHGIIIQNRKKILR